MQHAAFAVLFLKDMRHAAGISIFRPKSPSSYYVQLTLWRCSRERQAYCTGHEECGTRAARICIVSRSVLLFYLLALSCLVHTSIYIYTW